jgi:TonB family protein
VDSGPLSFDTVGYDWGAYAAEMIRKIKRNWDIPSLARYGIKGRLSIRFYILKDGTVEAERIVSTSGKPPFDNSSFQAIARSSPFRPLPADLGHDREGVTITFLYNIRPEDYDRPDEGSGRPADPSGRN